MIIWRTTTILCSHPFTIRTSPSGAPSAESMERAEAELPERVQDACSLVKIVGLLNIFAPQGARIDASFLRDYAALTLGMRDVDALLQELETRQILRFVRFRETFVLFDGTDLNIELALLEAGNKVEPIHDVTPRLRQYFTFPYRAGQGRLLPDRHAPFLWLPVDG